MFITKKKYDSYIGLYQKLAKETKTKMYIFGSLFYFFNSLILLTTFFNGLIAVLFLAGTLKGEYFDSGINPYKTALNESSMYVIITTILNSFITFLSALLSLFVFNKKYAFYKTKLQVMEFEYAYFQNKLYLYKDKNDFNAEFLLYARIIKILEVERFRTIELIQPEEKLETENNELTNEGEKNGK
ncbi:DUF4231 domain-containing protein [Mycoplasma sp. Pen4]|uniref:DUF4231 domain-containing protein n=1 Tax=Mycoplasma sp. Pen4 TaxID=640330 RepID=UPI00165430D7|nr:DUF4231 domain-containing protein [Mycoplasma sp. Pen4]QNM93914.1 DUF4231 domain-containing protein [Mycoplasma sp. Pen4]